MTKGAVIVAHHERAEAAALALERVQVAGRPRLTVWMPPDDAAALDLDDLAATRSPSEADLAISLGGDGTMLRTVELLGGSATDILGVNVGQLGYLTEVEPGALRERARPLRRRRVRDRGADDALGRRRSGR